MARVTIEDSLKVEPNIFKLIKLASLRAHQLQHGAQCKVNRKSHPKQPENFPTILALREIAAGFTDFDNEIIPKKDMWGQDIEPPKITTVKHPAIIAPYKKKEE